MSKKILTATFLLFCLTVLGQTQKGLDINYILRGYIYASSTIEDTLSWGGFGGSENYPKQLDSSLNFKEAGLFLKIDSSMYSTFAEKYNGYTLYIVNKSDTIIKLEASDSRLYVIAEAFVDNKWQPIEYLPSSWCGNSSHYVYLKPNQYWTFTIPKYKGKIKTKIRYRLLIGNEYIYSNEIIEGINKKQFTKKQGHKPTGLMDPYND